MASEANAALLDAATRGDVAEMDRLIAAGADVNALVGSWTPLLRAALNGHETAIAALLAAGAHVDAMNNAGYTPLVYAAFKGHAPAIDALLAAGANVDHALDGGETALYCASMQGHLDAAVALLQAGARGNAQNKRGKRPIDVVRCAACLLALLVSAMRRGTLSHRVVAPCRCALPLAV
jgi:ankyrin repeat protein